MPPRRYFGDSPSVEKFRNTLLQETQRQNQQKLTDEIFHDWSAMISPPPPPPEPQIVFVESEPDDKVWAKRWR